MGATTGPILALGGIVWANNVLLNDKPFDWRVPVATGGLCVIGALAERVAPTASVGVVWLAIVTVLFTRLNKTPSPAENALKWWNDW